MAAKDKIRRNKTAIQTTLSGDGMFILNKVYENKLITRREYKKLKSINKEDEEGHVIELVDKIMDKGEDSCQDFLNLLQTDDEIQETFPDLKYIQLNDACLLPTPVQVSSVHESDVLPPGSKRQKEAVAQRETDHHVTRMELEKLKIQMAQQEQDKLTDYYALTHKPHGLCVIINNEKFLGLSLKDRPGSRQDERALDTVFTRLGFKVVTHNNLTAGAMRRELQQLGSRNFLHDDALVVCVLSHGLKGCVFGTEGQTVSLRELTKPFTSREAPTLAGKPKLFFIQACQETIYRNGPVSADHPGSMPHPLRPRQEEGDRRGRLEEDAGLVLYESVPCDDDFLLGMATLPESRSFRNPVTGYVYIQELCTQLTRAAESPEKADILDVLTRVNTEVSKGEFFYYKQMPEPKNTLNKKLVLKFV